MNARAIQLFGIVGICLVLAFHTPMAFADIFNVSNGNELWDALQEAATNDADDVINLAAGIYDQHIPDPYVQFANFVCNPVESEPRSLTIQGGPGTTPNQVILDGHHYGYVLSIFDGTPGDFPPPVVLPEINIFGLTIKNGHARYDAGGLAIHSYFHHVTVRNCRITDNTSEDGRGGGARIFSRHGELTFENNLVMSNRLFARETMSALGSAMTCEGAGVQIIHQGETATIQNNIFANNTAEGDNGTGGGLYLGGWLCGASWRTWNLVNNTIVDNTARYGGGLFTSLHGAINLYNNIIYANDSPVADPGPTDFWVAEHCSSDEVVVHHNNFSNGSAFIDESVANQDIDPEFIGFYHLPSGSLLIDAGTDGVPSGLPGTDYEGDPRVCQHLPDIGADERCGGGMQPYPTIQRKILSVQSFNLQDPDQAIQQGIQVTIDPPSTDFFCGDTLFLTCARDGGGLNSPRLLLVDANDGHTVYDIPDCDTGGPAMLFHHSWRVDPSIPPGDYRVYVEQPGLVCSAPLLVGRSEQSRRIRPCHGYSPSFTIRCPDMVDTQNVPLITIVQPTSGETYQTNEFINLSWQNSQGEMDGDVAYTRILLKDGVELDRIGPTNYAGRSLEDQINLYGYLSGSDYQVRVELTVIDPDRGPVLVTSATSDYFNVQNYEDSEINCNTQHPLVVYSPRGGTFRHGDVLPIQLCNYPPFSDMQLRVHLVRDSIAGGGEWTISDGTWASPCGAIGDCDPERDIDLLWVIPDDIPAGGGYRVYVQQIGSEGESLSVEPFDIE